MRIKDEIEIEINIKKILDTGLIIVNMNWENICTFRGGEGEREREIRKYQVNRVNQMDICSCVCVCMCAAEIDWKCESGSGNKSIIIS